MKKFSVKVVVNIKPSVKDIKGLTLKQAVEDILSVENLQCRVGNIYTFRFDADNQAQAAKIVEKIAQEILANEVIETYEIVELEEVNEQN